MPRSFTISKLGPVATLTESTHIGQQLQVAKNLLLRPTGAFKGVPKFERLWALGAAATMATTIRAIPAPGGGTLGNSHNTVALKVSRQGKSFLLFYNLPADECRGLFYLGDDGSYTAGAYDFEATGATWTVLATDLDDAARWYGAPTYGQWFLQNGVDDPVCVQLARTAKAPGIWRKAGSNVAPGKPTVSLLTPSKDGNTQATYVIPASGAGSRTGGVALTFTANPDNFPGVNGNSRIFVAILQDPYAVVITSKLTGSGTVADPYHYTLNTGPSAAASSNTALATFVNQDSKALSILSASTASPDATADTQSWAMTALANGAGTGTSDGFSNRTVTVYARYFDAGVNGLGYEGINSPLSDEIIIDATSQNDICVKVPVNATAESGRFDSVRLYLQFGEDAEKDWYLVDPENPVPNGAVVEHAPITFVDGTPKTILSVNVSSNVVRIDGHGFENGQTIVFETTGTIMGGITAGAPVFVINATLNTFKVSATLGGSAINITTAGTGTRTAARHSFYFTEAAHPYANGDVVRVSAISASLSTYFAIDTDYHIVEATTDTFALAATAGGQAIGIPVYIGGSPTPSLTVSVTTKSYVIGSNTPFGDVMYAEQNRPLPHKYAVITNGQTWRGATTTYAERLYPSKPANDYELAPEGCNLAAYEIARGVNDSSSAKITALYSDGYRLHFHTPQSVGIVDPANPESQQFPPMSAGALNGSTLVTWTSGKLFYLGSDLGLYQFDGQRYGKRQADLMTTGVAAYIRDHTDATAIGRNPDRVFLFADVPNQFIWFWLPGPTHPVGFAFDFAAGGLTGPFDVPRAYAACRMEPERPEIIFADEDGNLFVWDTSDQDDHGDTLPTQTAFTAHDSPDTAPVGQAGWDVVTWEGSDYRQAVITELETGFFDLGKPDLMKRWTGLTFSSLPNSRALVRVTVYGKNTGSICSRLYGDIGQNQTALCSHKLLFNRLDTAIKLKIQLLAAEQKTWTLRDMTLLWDPAGQV